uniref:Uncharacterized protein n=1 Tax=Plectus sambesii TaxID=2011161 RepID=A0A914WJ34_9BILA
MDSITGRAVDGAAEGRRWALAGSVASTNHGRYRSAARRRSFVVLVAGRRSFLQLTGASFCGTGAIPFRFEVLPNGLPVLGCATPSCFGGDDSGRLSRQDSQFINGPGGIKDGFLREGDEERPRFRHPDAPPQRATCSPEASEENCAGAERWLAGLKQLEESTDASAVDDSPSSRHRSPHCPNSRPIGTLSVCSDAAMRFSGVGILLVALVSAVFGQEAGGDTTLLRARCGRGQLVHRVSVFEDGVIEAECGPQPCGVSGARCRENQAACRDRSDVLAGMHWSSNGQSLVLRCCTLEMPERVYVGTDLISHGSFYSGGLVAPSDSIGLGNIEYDYVSNLRMELDGVRVWVYRLMCPNDQRGANTTAPRVIGTTVPPPFSAPVATNVPQSQTQGQSNSVGQSNNPVLFGQQAPGLNPSPAAPAGLPAPFAAAAARPAAPAAASSAFAAPVNSAALPAASSFASPAASPGVASFPAPPPPPPVASPPHAFPFALPALPAAPAAVPAAPLAAQSAAPSVPPFVPSVAPASQPPTAPETSAVEQPELSEEERRRREDYARRRQILLNRFGPPTKHRPV